ncbi:alpha-1,2-fucosyltransferase [Patescibacteria group bacterium]|nr:alpha-1,2-fucosyltransferase [Patescibacteria group bacterium]
MIILNLKGGTGNQLFQYAFAKHLAVKNIDTIKLEVDGLARANEIGDIYRPLSLSHFSCDYTVATAIEVQRLKYPFGIISKAWRYFKAKVLRQYYLVYDPRALNWKGDLFIDGYFQSPRYFEAIRDVLLKDFVLKKPFSIPAAHFRDHIKASIAVSLHIRRADYAQNPRVRSEYGLCTIGYYKRAMAHIEATCPSPTYFVFSDDIPWVKANLPMGENVVFVHDPLLSDVEELMLMSLCQHNIIANSSFSWWGAWLNQNPDKIVVAPTPWFDHATYDKDLLPKTWVQLPKA